MKSFYVDLTPYYGILRVSGQDAFTFLQGQLTCDMREINETELKLGGHCNLKGRLRALYRIFKKDNAFYLQAPLSVIQSGKAHLNTYAKFSKVSIEDISHQIRIWGIHLPLSSSSNNFASTTELSFSMLSLPFSPHRFQILQFLEHSIEPSLVKDHITTIHFPGIPKDNFERWKFLDIQQKIPEVWSETVEQLLPHHINLPQLGGVSFNKGCYCGQEIVARMEYRGNIKRALEHISLNNPRHVSDSHKLTPGEILYNDKNEELGLIVTSSIPSSENQIEMLILRINEST